MTLAELVSEYTYEGDLATYFLCVILLIIIRKTLFFSDDINFFYMKRSVHLIMGAAVSNMVFGLVCNYTSDAFTSVLALRYLYNIMLASTLYIYIFYTKNLCNIEEEKNKIYTLITRVAFSLYFILEVTSQFTHFGIYYENGWHDPAILTPFTFIYAYSTISFIYLLIPAKKLISPVRYSLIITEILAGMMILFEVTRKTTSLIAFTFTMPLLAVLILIHSKPYDLVTGAMTDNSFNSYYNLAEKNGNSIDYMILKLDLKNRNHVPAQVGDEMHDFWKNYFYDPLFFTMKNDVFVLAIERSKHNTDNPAKIEKLVNEKFSECYLRHGIPYKIIVIPDEKEITNTEILRDYIYYFSGMIKYNEVLWVDEELKKNLRTANSIKALLADIELKNDLNDERVLVYCQPVKNTKTDSYDTAESLMRLKAPDGTMYYPDSFIPVAEQYGYIHTLSKIILNKVCRYINSCIDKGYEINRISVNFSALELREEEFCSEIFEIIKSNHIPYTKLGIELTETQNENDYNIIREKIKELKEFGIKIYLDDFGTGYSNFEKILKLGMDVIKFDRSLLLCADTDKNVTFTLQHFSQAFKELKYDILFEGVETGDQESLCSSCDADYLQGYKYSRPIPIENLTEFLEKNK